MSRFKSLVRHLLAVWLRASTQPLCVSFFPSVYLHSGFEGHVSTMHGEQWLVWYTANKGLLHSIFIILNIFLMKRFYTERLISPLKA